MSNLLASAAALAPLMIAQVPAGASRNELMTVFLAIAALLVIANQAIVFARHFREQPPPAQTYATKAEMGRLEMDLRLFNQQQDERASKIHSRVDQVLAAVSRIEGVVEGRSTK